MSTVGIIDDKYDLRETLKRRLDLELSDKWNIIDNEPLPNLKDYPSWLTENGVSVLLLDEKLHEQTLVDYNGHDLVSYLRPLLPTFPIFVITSYPDDPELSKKFKDVEGIVPRDEFSINADKYVPRFTRSAQRYLESFQSELSELSDISKKIAQGEAKKKDIKKAEAIQNKIGLAFPYETLESRGEWLNELESKLKELEKVKVEVEKFLNKSHKK